MRKGHAQQQHKAGQHLLSTIATAGWDNWSPELAMHTATSTAAMLAADAVTVPLPCTLQPGTRPPLQPPPLTSFMPSIASPTNVCRSPLSLAVALGNTLNQERG